MPQVAKVELTRGVSEGRESLCLADASDYDRLFTDVPLELLQSRRNVTNSAYSSHAVAKTEFGVKL